MPIESSAISGEAFYRSPYNGNIRHTIHSDVGCGALGN